MLVDELVQKITIKADTKALDVVQHKEKKLIATTNTLGASIKSAFKWLGGGLLIKSVIDASVSLDSLNRSFNAIAGSSQEGAKQIAYLRAEAMRLGQDFPTIANAYKNFFAVGKGAGMATGETQSIFTSILEASTVLGSSSQQVEGALLAIEQMISKGKVSMEELRRQLGNALPGAMQIAAKAMGTTSAEFEKLLSKGLPSLDFVRKFSAELRKTYSGSKLTEPVKSLRAELARLKNAWYFVRSDLLDGEAGKALAQAIREITTLLMSEGFKTALKLIGTTLTLVLKNIKLIALTWGLSKLFRLISGTHTFALALRAFNFQLATSGSLSVAFGTGLKGMARGMILFSKSVFAVSKPLLIIASTLLLIEDLYETFFGDKDTFFKRQGTNLANKVEELEKEHPIIAEVVKKAIPGFGLGEQMAEVQQNPFKLNQIANPNMFFGAGELDAMNAMINEKIRQNEIAKQQQLTIEQQQAQSPQIVQNNYITTQNIDQNMLDERIKGQVRGMFLQTAQGGAK